MTYLTRTLKHLKNTISESLVLDSLDKPIPIEKVLYDFNTATADDWIAGCDSDIGGLSTVSCKSAICRGTRRKDYLGLGLVRGNPNPSIDYLHSRIID